MKTKSYSHESRLFVAVSVLFRCFRPHIRQTFIQLILQNFSSDSVFFTRSSSGALS